MNSEENNKVITNEENIDSTNVEQAPVSEVAEEGISMPTTEEINNDTPVGNTNTNVNVKPQIDSVISESQEVTPEQPTIEPIVETPIESTNTSVNVEPQTDSVISEPQEVITEQPTIEPTIETTPTVEGPTIEDIPDNSQVVDNSSTISTPTVEKTEEIEKLDPTQKIATAEEIKEAANMKVAPPTEKQQKGGPNGFKRFMAIVLFLGFFALVFFMPEVTRFVNEWRASGQPVQKVTDGTSTCTLTKTTEKFDVTITAKFTINNSKLRKLDYVTVSKGNAEEDKEELNKLKEECLVLKQEAGELKGVSISCSLNGDTATNRQALDYELLDMNQVTSAYTEAGGIYPEFTKGEDIDKIEGKMQKAGYKCNRR